MSESIAHRGPDSDGVLVSDGASYVLTECEALEREWGTVRPLVILIHRRFSIIDLSPAGAQPFISSDGMVTIALNGEVYNFVELRQELEKTGRYKFRSDSDTEVALYSYLEWGLDCFRRFNGFWGMAIFDRRLQSVILSRDRFAKKPLYIKRIQSGFAFASELRPLISLEDEVRVNEEAAYDYLGFDQRDVRQPSLFASIAEVEAGGYEVYGLDGVLKSADRYYRLPLVDAASASLDYNEIVEEYKALLINAVKLRLRADVPVDINLSGGLDSTAIAWATAHLGHANIGVHTFSSTESKGHDESAAASKIAKSLGLNIDIVKFSQSDVWPSIEAHIFDSEEPVHSPITFVQKAAWQTVADENFKVILHGSGNDELMFGYPYFEQIFLMNQICRGRILSLLSSRSASVGKNIGRLFKWAVFRQSIRYQNHLSKLYPLSGLSEGFKSRLTSRGQHIIDELAALNRSPEDRRLAEIERLRFPYWNKLMDKNSMSIPIEIRMPYLDTDLVNFVMRLPAQVFFSSGYTKSILREIIRPHIPSDITNNPVKTGFQSPDKLWVLENRDRILREIAEYDNGEFLDSDFIGRNFDSLPVRFLWRAYNFAVWRKVFGVAS
jgi:asparagine synthase (glutamine-hydrolysing)